MESMRGQTRGSCLLTSLSSVHASSGWEGIPIRTEGSKERRVRGVHHETLDVGTTLRPDSKLWELRQPVEQLSRGFLEQLR